MNSVRRIAFIGNYLPRRCGIATFTTDLQSAISTAFPGIDSSVIAMTDANSVYDYPEIVGFEINEGQIGDYDQAAQFVNEGAFDVVCLQHEYGIFGGEAGGHITKFLSNVDVPVVTTLHTVLSEPEPAQFKVMEQILKASARVVVMSEKARELLRDVHGLASDKIDVIPHGIPDVPFTAPDGAKERFGFGGRKVILTFGLLSPNKGIEAMIEAMPAIVASCPDALYVILGATHPNLQRQHGEAYRNTLVARVRDLGLEQHVVLVNTFVEQHTLLEYISACDVYVTPYLHEQQMTSGTLAYSYGLGRAVVSTPYWHASELLSSGRGVLVPFNDVDAMSREISDLLTNDERRNGMSSAAYSDSRSMTWHHTAHRYLAAFGEARDAPETGHRHYGALQSQESRRPFEVPEVRTQFFQTMCDDTGMLQHSVYAVADRSHGYCVDDNARALLLACSMQSRGETALPDTMTARFTAFIQHAWNPDRRRFRNFMSFDRRWLEEQGSEDSHGRTLWALGVSAARDSSDMRRRWAAALFRSALPVVAEFTSPRSWAFTLLGLNSYCASQTSDHDAARMRDLLAKRLMAELAAAQSDQWMWFESVLSYDNARLSQALIETGLATAKPAYINAGLKTLKWLMTRQTSPVGLFRPVGTMCFGDTSQKLKLFDQQPVEAWATIAACLAAHRADGSAEWVDGAMRAMQWFLGANDLNVPLADIATGSCCDGLHFDRRNENRGAESVLSYLMATLEIRNFIGNVKQTGAQPASKLVRSSESRAIASRQNLGGSIVKKPFSDPAGPASPSRSGASRRTAV